MRHVLPKALSGSDALQIMKNKEDMKLKELETKEERKTAREAMRLRKQNEKLERQEAAKKRKIDREVKKQKKDVETVTKRRNKKGVTKTEADDFSSDDSASNIVYAESDDHMDIDVNVCPSCEQPGGDIGCDYCPRFWHKICSGLPDFMLDTNSDDIESIDFMCGICQFSWTATVLHIFFFGLKILS